MIRKIYYSFDIDVKTNTVIGINCHKTSWLFSFILNVCNSGTPLGRRPNPPTPHLPIDLYDKFVNELNLLRNERA